MTEKDFTWKMAIDIENAMETADIQAKALRNEANSNSINKVEEYKPQQTWVPSSIETTKTTSPASDVVKIIHLNPAF